MKDAHEQDEQDEQDEQGERIRENWEAAQNKRMTMTGFEEIFEDRDPFEFL